jgi:hypothetical protein
LRFFVKTRRRGLLCILFVWDDPLPTNSSR